MTTEIKVTGDQSGTITQLIVNQLSTGATKSTYDPTTTHWSIERSDLGIIDVFGETVKYAVGIYNGDSLNYTHGPFDTEFEIFNTTPTELKSMAVKLIRVGSEDKHEVVGLYDPTIGWLIKRS